MSATEHRCPGRLDPEHVPNHEATDCTREQGHPGMHLTSDGVNWTDDFGVTRRSGASEPHGHIGSDARGDAKDAAT